MTFKLTYATMFNPPEELHARFDAAMAQAQAALGRRHELFIVGEDRPARRVMQKRNPADREQLLGEFAAAGAAEVDEALRAANGAWSAWKHTPVGTRLQLLRRVGKLIEERVYDI